MHRRDKRRPYLFREKECWQFAHSIRTKVWNGRQGEHTGPIKRERKRRGVCHEVHAWDVKTRYLLVCHITKDVRTDSIRIHDFLTTWDQMSFASFARQLAHGDTFLRGCFNVPTLKHILFPLFLARSRYTKHVQVPYEFLISTLERLLLA